MISSDLLAEELEALRSKDLYRQCRVIENLDGVHGLFDGKPALLFCGNDYLGLAHHPRVVGAAKKAAKKYGIGSGAARLVSGTSPLHDQLEKKLAKMKKKEKAIVFTAGYLANLGVITAFAGDEDLIVMDKLCHASIVDGARLSGAQIRVFPHKNYKRCEEILQNASGFRRILLLSDTVFSMDGDLADLSELVRLKQKYSVLLIVDDAHGLGVLKENIQPDLSEVDIVVGTLSKTLGCIGGFAAASDVMIQYIVNFARSFIFATSPPPLICAAAIEALNIVADEPETRVRLWKNIDFLYQSLTHLGFEIPEPVSPILPLLIGEEGEALQISQSLLKEGIFIPAIRTPTVPKGKARLRITVSAAHSQADLDRLVDVFHNMPYNAKKRRRN